MIRSILTLLKNQFGQNILPGVFICFVTVLLFYVVDFTVTYGRLYHIPNGASPENCYAFHIDKLGDSEMRGDTLIENYFRLTGQIARLPGVTASCNSGYAYPYSNWGWNEDVTLDSLNSAGVYNRFIDNNYFGLFKLRLLEGRWFTPEEIDNKEALVVVSENVARDLAGKQSIIGRKVKAGFSETDSLYRVIGVVAGIKYQDFELPAPSIYIPLAYFYENEEPRIPQLIVHVPQANEAQFAPALDNFIVHHLRETGFNITEFIPLGKLRTDNNSYISKDLKIYAMGVGFFLINILLAIFGTFTFRMRRRTGELGVRVALGSTKRGLFAYVLSEALLLTSFCLAISFVICLNIVQLDLLVDKLPVTAPRVAASFGITAVIMLLTIAVSVYIPARKAASIAPAEALHYE